MRAVVGTKVWVTVGVDTHTEIHVAAALDQVGRFVGDALDPHNRPATRLCSSGCAGSRSRGAVHQSHSRPGLWSGG